MRYETFKEELMYALNRQLGEEVNITTESVPKNNGVVKEGLVFRRKDSRVSPAIFVHDIYLRIRDKNFDYDELAKRLIEISTLERDKLEEKVDIFLDFYSARENIFVQVVNAQWNRERLENLPHENVLDLAIVCSYHVQEESMGNASILIDNNQVKRWGITPEQLISLGKANTARKFPVCLTSLSDMLRMIAQDMPEEGEERIPPELEEECPMYILTNVEKCYGAYALFYPNVQQHVADVLNSSFFILPSSIHETILVPDSGLYTPNELQEMVKSVNSTQVDPREKLSNDVYFYDRRKKQLSIVAADA